MQVEFQISGNTVRNSSLQKSQSIPPKGKCLSPDAQQSVSGARATDSARVAKFTKELSANSVVLGKLFMLATYSFLLHNL